MLQDETCFFLGVDFDRESWKPDAEAFLQTCRRLDVPAALERSRSGNGGHVWFFFEESIPAALARKLGSHILTETMENRPEIGLRSYDRLFPNQDTLPRGGFGNLIALPLQKQARQRDNTVFLDEQFSPYPDQWALLASLRRISRERVEALLHHDTGVLAATTAFGKTVIAAWLIAQRGVNTLVLVHRQQLLEQWIERLSVFLGLPAKAIGQLGGGRKKLSGTLDVALMQSLVRKGAVEDRLGDYGHLVVDECHHLSARSFELVARRAKAKFVTGLSATVTRKDGHHPIIFMQCGPVRYRVDAKQQAAARPFTHQVLVRPAGFRPPALPANVRTDVRRLTLPDRTRAAAMKSEPRDLGCYGVRQDIQTRSGPDPRVEFQWLCNALRSDDARNRMICADVVNAVREGRSPLLLTERTEHLQHLAERLSSDIPHVITLQGGMGRKELQAALARLAETPHTIGRLILATGRYIGEGFDNPQLDTLFLAMPVSWRGTIAQYVGRLHRLHEGNREVRVYDYADLDVPMLARMFDKRCRGYEALGYSILLPGSALPGWPAEVPLPIDPEWKQDYAASIRRLVLDGVDVPLANLFVHAARSPSADAEGENRARSASEAFLYRRLQTLPETAGRFRLNVELPIPFDGRGRMEADLLCAEEKLVIELDGGQHLADAEAYRRDRRKDALLQQHGYFVLRFLAEDAGKRLDDILDAVLAALVHRRNRPETLR